MISTHQDAIGLFVEAVNAEGVPDADLRQFAENGLPILRAHLQEAQILQNQLNP